MVRIDPDIVWHGISSSRSWYPLVSTCTVMGTCACDMLWPAFGDRANLGLNLFYTLSQFQYACHSVWAQCRRKLQRLQRRPGRPVHYYCLLRLSLCVTIWGSTDYFCWHLLGQLTLAQHHRIPQLQPLKPKPLWMLVLLRLAKPGRLSESMQAWGYRDRYGLLVGSIAFSLILF